MLGIIINPKSGKKAFRAQRIYLWKLLRKRHLPFAYRVTKYAGHAIELARELVEKGYDEILILGGDGTLSEAINGIMRSTLTPEQRAKIQVGLMPRGTGNDWGRYWNLDKRFKESLRRFFGEVCAVNRVDFLTLEKAMKIGQIKIGMSEAKAKAPKALQDAVALVVCQVANHIDQIKGMEDAPEIMDEYKQRFDVGAAVAAVQDRKRRIQAERDAAEKRAAALAAQEAAKDKVAASIPIAEPPKAAERQQEAEAVFPLVRLTLKNITKKQVRNLKSYLEQEGIEYA